MTASPGDPLDLLGPLPEHGHLAIEASAGTGKTYTLAALACRYVAEAELPVDQLLVVTFTRAAAAELRERIRNRIAGAAHVLAGHVDSDGDPVLEHLMAGEPDVISARRRRLARAVTDFDTATITTIHGFCSQVLLAQGASGRFDPAAVLVQDPSDLVTSVCADLLVLTALGDGSVDADGLPRDTLLRTLVGVRLSNPGTIAVSSGGDNPATADLVERVAAEVRERLVQIGAVTFDDQLERVAELVQEHPEIGRALSAQFRVVMIDECQDTDPIQWSALSGAFSGTRSSVLMVGDPKQAIYAFRGGDVHNYLEASRAADERRTLDVNHRSDAAVVEAMNRICAGLTLGDADIAYREVKPSPRLTGRRLLKADDSTLPGLWVRSVSDPDQPRNKPAKGLPGPVTADRARTTIREDLADTVVGLLDTVDLEDPDDPDDPRRGLRPDDIAVLVKAKAHAAPVQRTLAERGVASVIIGAGSVLESLAATHWRWLLLALARPSDPRLARAAALSWFFGETAEGVAATTGPDPDEGGDEVLARVQQALLEWADVLRNQGVAGFTTRVWTDAGLRARVLRRPSGERDLTDLEHLSELLQSASSGRPVGPEMLVELFDSLEVPGEDVVDDPDAIRRRVDSDTAAVRIMTVHASKGLEFGVVCCPTLWSGDANRSYRLYHDPDTRQRCLDVSRSPDAVVKAAAAEEAAGEQSRLAYVALTRARHLSIVWWAPAPSASSSGVARMLFGVDDDGTAQVPPDNTSHADALRDRVRALAADRVVQVDQVPPTAQGLSLVTRFDRGTEVAGPLAIADAPVIDRTRGRWSFTGVTRRAADTPPSEDLPAPPPVDARDESLGDASDADEQVPPPPVLFEGLGAGAAFGSLVHSALEQVDFTGDVESELTGVLDVPWSVVDPDAAPRLAAAIAAAVRTPMGDPFGDLCLADLGVRDRLDELDFELPLRRPGVPGPVDALAVRSIGALVVDHLADGDPLRPWAEGVAGGSLPADLGGFLTGSIDLVMRYRLEGRTVYSVVDYKTNRLGPWDRPDTVANYHPDRLPAAMAEHHYPLQALLYSVTLHRYLRWRLPGYSPEEHLGPVGYLFVRGMVGPGTPSVGGRRHGVFDWRPGADLVVVLSDLLDRTGGESA